MEDREELLQEITTIMMRYDVPVQDIRSAIFLAFDKYEIQSRTTDIVLREQDDTWHYANKFLQAKKISGCTDATIRTYRATLKMFFNEIQKSPKELTADDIRKFIAIKEVRDHASKGYAQDLLRPISSFCQWMLDNGYTSQNPVRKVERIKYKPKKEKAFSDMEVEMLRGSCRNAREKTIVEVLLSTGCRVSELCNIKISDLDMQNGKCEVFGKGEKYRVVYLNAKALIAIQSYLNERKDKNPYLLPKSNTGDVGRNPNYYISTCTKGRVKPHMWYTLTELISEYEKADKSTIGAIVRKIGKRAKVDNTHPHRFRKTCATNALKRGMPLELVSKMLGHESVETTQIYLDIKEEELEYAHKKYMNG